MKKLLLFGAIFVVVGIIICAVALAMDVEFYMEKLDEKTYEIQEDFSKIQTDTRDTNITFHLSEDGVCRVVCQEKEHETHTVKAENGTLFLRQENNKKWYHYIGFDFHTSSVDVYLPKAAFEALNMDGSTGDVTVPKELRFTNAVIHASTGDIDMQAQVEKDLTVAVNTGRVLVSGIRCGNMDLKASTGAIIVRDIDCANLTTKTSTGDQRWERVQASGDIQVTCSTGDLYMTLVNCQNLSAESDTGKKSLEYVVAAGNVWLEASTGDIHLVNFDGGTIKITTDTGDVTGTILSDKIFLVQTDTGRVDVPHGTSGGSCEITTDTGDISIQILKQEV